MKRITFLICALVATIPSLWAYDFEVDGIYYNITDTDNLQVEVASGGNYSGSITIPSNVSYNDIIYSVTSIGEFAFESCRGLTSVTIPNSVTSIGSFAFSVCTGLTEVTIPNSVASIGGSAFGACTGLTEVTIPNSVASIGSFAFGDCTGLTEVTLSNRMADISEGLFEGCTALTAVVISDRVTSIGERAFEGCTGLTTVTIGKRVSSIGGTRGSYYSFNNCPNLKEFIVHEENETYSSVDGVLCNKAGTTLLCYPNGKASNYTLPNTITLIGGFAFSGCTGLTEVTIPNSVTTIWAAAFQGCTGLTEVTIPNSVTSTGERAFSGCTGLTEVAIGDGVKTIGSSAFENCTGLTEITIPNSVTSIGERAFSGCTGLTEVAIGDGVKTINYYTFSGCTDLTTVTIGDGVEMINYYAFLGCTGVTSIYSQNPTPPTLRDAFEATVINNATLYVPTGSRSAYEDADVWWQFMSIIEIDEDDTCTLTLKVADNSMGTIKGEGQYFNNTEVTIEAVPNPGYRFVRWSDGNTDNPRTLTITEDMSLTAEFEMITYQLSVQSNNESLGSVMGNSGSYRENEEITIVAIPQGGVTFVQWSDGNTDNPRTVTMTEDMSLTAQFTQPAPQVNAFANDATLGDVSKAVLLEAIPTDNASFVQWSDGETDNPRTLYPTENITLTAEFKESINTHVDTLDATGIYIYTTEEAVYINQAPAGERITIYDLSGRMVKLEEAEGGSTRIALDAGAYLVRVDNHIVKVVL